MSDQPGKVVLIIRDGWGRNPNPAHDPFNAVKLAATPRCDQLLASYPWTLIHTSGEDVGLPDGTMGNSEVGHQNIGAGRIVDQDSGMISKAIRLGSFFQNDVLRTAVARARDAGKRVHLLGLASDAGVHSLMGHLYACLELCRREGAANVAIHAFTDGRDSGPYTGKACVEQIEARCRELGVGRVASIIGRYYAMDRDNRWERVRQAYELLTARGDCANAPAFPTAAAALQNYYDNPTSPSQQGDEFVTQRRIGPPAPIAHGDTVIFFNFRGDRPRELTRAFVMPEFLGHVKPSPDTGTPGFDRGPRLDLHFVTMTGYEAALNPLVHVAFPKPPKLANIAGEYIAGLGLKQFRCAETEKFPHVTFFFNDYRDEPFHGELREMAQSPKVPTYDLQPEMSAPQITSLVLNRIAADDCHFIVVNFANGDMVGHTGKLDAAIKAIETVDHCVGSIVDAATARGYRLIVTADHGNAEQMWDTVNNCPHTAHTTYPVECILVGEDLRPLAGGSADTPSAALRSDGRLADVVPTALALMRLPTPQQMSGQSLLR